MYLYHTWWPTFKKSVMTTTVYFVWWIKSCDIFWQCSYKVYVVHSKVLIFQNSQDRAGVGKYCQALPSNLDWLKTRNHWKCYLFWPCTDLASEYLKMTVGTMPVRIHWKLWPTPKHEPGSVHEDFKRTLCKFDFWIWIYSIFRYSPSHKTHRYHIFDKTSTYVSHCLTSFSYVHQLEVSSWLVFVDLQGAVCQFSRL